MRHPGGGGGTADSDYGTFVSDLYDKLNRFSELYQDRTSTTRTSMYELPPSKEEVAADSDISSEVQFMLGATSTTSLVEAVAADKEMIENLDSVPDSSEATDDVAGSRIETALGYVNHALETWEGQDATQFHTYLGSVRLALHRQEVLIEALHALAHVHHRIVAKARNDMLELLEAANCALENIGLFNWGAGETSRALTIVGTVFGIGVALTTGGAAAGLGIAGALASGAGGLIGSGEDQEGEGRDYDISGDSEEIRATTITLIGELRSDVEEKCNDLRQALQNLRDIISSGGAEIGADELLPKKPDVYENGNPDRFKLPVYVPIEP